MTPLSTGRYQCRCRACGFSWSDPPLLRPMKDRRKAPRTEALE
jgi:hypothetical protein